MGDLVEDPLAIGAKVLWQQLGVKNAEATRKAEAAGLDSVMFLRAARLSVATSAPSIFALPLSGFNTV